MVAFSVKIIKNGVESCMVSEPTEKELDELRKQFGINESDSESSFFDHPLFHGDFGHTLGVPFLITMLLLVSIVISLIIYKKKKRRKLT